MKSQGKGKGGEGLLGRRTACYRMSVELLLLKKREEGGGVFTNGAYLVKTSPAAK
jgi:hypothetical protein